MTILTVAELKKRVDGMPDHAKVYAYVSSDTGLKVQAEWPVEGDGVSEPGYGTVLEAPIQLSSGACL